MRQKKKIIKITALCLISIIALYGCSYFIRLGTYKRAISTMTFNTIDLSTIPDGHYIGECDVDFISAKVDVTISNKAIKSVDLLEHHNGKGTPAEAIIDTIVQEQTTDVDAVTGATNSSKVIKKAIENALLSAN